MFPHKPNNQPIYLVHCFGLCVDDKKNQMQINVVLNNTSTSLKLFITDKNSTRFQGFITNNLYEKTKNVHMIESYP
jgi:hypothetical protein